MKIHMLPFNLSLKTENTGNNNIPSLFSIFRLLTDLQVKQDKPNDTTAYFRATSAIY